MMFFLMAFASLAVANIVYSVVQVLRDGYGHPSTLPTHRPAQYQQWPTDPNR